MSEIYAFPKAIIAVTPFIYDDCPHKEDPLDHIPAEFLAEIRLNRLISQLDQGLIISYLDLWLPRAAVFVPFGVPTQFVRRRCGYAPQVFQSNCNVNSAVNILVYVTTCDRKSAG